MSLKPRPSRRRQYPTLRDLIRQLHTKVTHMARTLADVQADLVAVKDDLGTIVLNLAALAQTIADLKAAGASAVTQEQLDALATQADELKATAAAAAGK